MKPTLGRIVLYKSKIDNGQDEQGRDLDVYSPAMVIRTRESTVITVIDRWAATPEAVTADDGTTVVPAPRPENLVEVLPDDWTVDLLVFGLGRVYHEYAVPQGTERGQWDWPARQPQHTPGGDPIPQPHPG